MHLQEQESACHSLLYWTRHCPLAPLSRHLHLLYTCLLPPGSHLQEQVRSSNTWVSPHSMEGQPHLDRWRVL